MPPLGLIFFGTAELAVPSLEALAAQPAFTIQAVVTQPDRPKGRALKLQPSPVKVRAVGLGLPVLQPERVRDESFIQGLGKLKPELIVVAAYGQILPAALLALPRWGCVNVHASLLPKYRGAAPIQWALLDGETETGVTIMKMDAGLDTGDILAMEATRIGLEEDAQILHDRLAQSGAELLIRTLPDYLAGKTLPRKQPAADASYARKITKEDGRLHWTESAAALGRRVRALTPWPGAFTFLPAEPPLSPSSGLEAGTPAPPAEIPPPVAPVAAKPALLKVWRAEIVERSGGRPGEILQAGPAGLVVACGQDALRITELQREGGKRLSAASFLAGHPLAPGLVLP